MSGALGAGLASLPLASMATESNKKSPLPNFIVYISDDHGLMDSGPYGNREVHTPNLNRLAAEGVTFNHAFCASPTCLPSRTALLTGLWPARNGVMPQRNVPLNPGVEKLPAVLHALGYEVAAIGKVAHGNYAKFYPFDYIAGPIGGAQDTTEVARFLSSRDASKPLCLFFGAHFPHMPWVENEGYDPAKLTPKPSWVDTLETREWLAKYYSSVSRTDALLGEYRELVKKHVPGDSLFIYTADHGASWPFGKWDVYDAGVRVPFIASWPGKLQPGTKNDAMICLPDLLPTFIELAGGKVPDGLDGKSFAGLLRGTDTTHRDRVFTAWWAAAGHNVYPMRSVRTRDWKYIRNLHPEFQRLTCVSLSGQFGFWPSWVERAKTDPSAAAILKRFRVRPAEELYDLRADPYELNDLASNPGQAARLAEMRAEVTAWMKQQGDHDKIYGEPLLIGQPTPVGGGHPC